MKIALIGYGKMGKAIEPLALERGHEIALKTGRNGFSADELKSVDVAIEFSNPESGFENIKKCVENGIPVVSGTTGWMHRFEEMKGLVDQNQGSFFYASNFSLGVNLFFNLNQHLAKLMAPYQEYNVSMEEIHHTQKLDAPSGTAITLAEGIFDNNDHLSNWTLEKPKPGELEIRHQRIDPTPGTHSIHYDSEIDSIEIKHTAHSRKGFALGSVIAAEWLKGKTGTFGMNDLLNL